MQAVDCSEPPSRTRMVRLLQTSAVTDIISWLEGDDGTKQKDAIENNGNQRWKEFQSLRPYFATSFTDFLRHDSRHLLDIDEPAVVAVETAADAPVLSDERAAGARRRLGVNPAQSAECGSAGRQPAAGGARRPAGLRQQRGREVPLHQLVTAADGRWSRRGRRERAGAPAPRRTLSPEPRFGGGAATEQDFVTPVKQVLRRGPGGVPVTGRAAAIQPADLDLVTGRDTLDRLSQLYAHLVERHHLIGLSIEVNFLVRLLVAPGSELPPPATSVFLTTVHNAVYLAVHALWHLRHQLVCLDSANLRLLATNERLAAFSGPLSQSLLTLQPAGPPAPPAAADADADTAAHHQPADSLTLNAPLVHRPNFPTDATFNAFRRQHDLLYALVARGRPVGVQQVQQLRDEARTLVALCPHPVNMHHLARLFQAQLVQLCGDPADTEHTTMAAPPLHHADSVRLQRLNDRLLRPVRAGVAGGRHHFPGVEEMFRQLVLGADSAELSAALRHQLTSSLLQLDAQPMQLPDTGLLASTVRHVSERIFRLRLLAKFLSLVTFRGLHCDDQIPEQVLTSAIAMRNRLPPPLDLLTCLQSAVQHGHLVVTLPWVIEYMCMMDRVSVLTSAHQTVFSLLVGLCGSLRLSVPSALTVHNALFLRLQYENLFEVHWHVQNLHDKDGLAAMDVHRVADVTASFHRLYTRPEPEPEPALGVDAHEVVQPSLLYACCPHLAEQRLALLQFRAGQPHRPSPTLRKIIPVTAVPANSAAVAARKTQAELEEGFFQSHHPSLRRTVSFVIERLASASIKLTRSRLLPAVTGPLLAGVRRQVTARVQHGQQHYQVKTWLQSRLADLVLERHSAVVGRLAAWYRAQVPALVAAAMHALLVGDDLTAGARSTCCQLTEAGVLNRLNCWLNANLTRDFLHQVMEEGCRAELRLAKHGAAHSSLSHPPEEGQMVTEEGQTATEDGQAATVEGQTATEEGQTATEEGQTATEQGQTATEQGQTATEQGQTATEEERTTTEEERTTTEEERTTIEEGQMVPEEGQITIEEQMATEEAAIEEALAAVEESLAAPMRGRVDSMLAELPDDDADVLSPSACLIQVKDALCDVMSDGGRISEPEVVRLLKDLASVHHQWRHVLPAAARSLQHLSLQLGVAIACGRPAMMSAHLEAALVATWRRVTTDPLTSLLAMPLAQCSAASTRPTAAVDCLRRLLTGVGATGDQLGPLHLCDARRQVPAPQPPPPPGATGDQLGPLQLCDARRQVAAPQPPPPPPGATGDQLGPLQLCDARRQVAAPQPPPPPPPGATGDQLGPLQRCDARRQVAAPQPPPGVQSTTTPLADHR